MNFLQTILQKLTQQPLKPILYEIHGAALEATSCGQVLTDICKARYVLGQAGLQPDDRCVLLGSNSSRWVALDASSRMFSVRVAG